MKDIHDTPVPDAIDTESPSIDEKAQMSEKDSGKGVSEKDVQVVAVDEDEDVIRESGMYSHMLRGRFRQKANGTMQIIRPSSISSC